MAPVAEVAPKAPAETVLNRREWQVLNLLARGLTGVEVTKRLSLSPQTVRRHVSNAKVKLRARTHVHAVVLAFRRGDVDIDHTLVLSEGAEPFLVPCDEDCSHDLRVPSEVAVAPARSREVGVELSPEDADRIGVGDGDPIEVSWSTGQVFGRVRVTGIRPGIVHAPGVPRDADGLKLKPAQDRGGR